MNCESVPQEMLKGGLTYYGIESVNGYEGAKPQFDAQANRWSATEANSNNSWNTNFGSGNYGNNNKYNSMVVRPVVAYGTPDDFLSLVYAAFEDCCSNKRTSKACIDYCEIAREDLPLLAHELYTGTYQPGASTCFLVKYPKCREVFAAGFRDRIVHHFLFLLLNPLFERRFVAQGNVSFNSRRGFGTLAAQGAAYKAIKLCTDNYRREAWVFRGDLVSFFMQIDKRLLWARMEPFIRDEYKGKYLWQVLDATRKTVFHRPELQCVFNTPPEEWASSVERGKSLFGTDEYHGMPIGNLTMQVFANFFLSFFDGWVMDWLRSHSQPPCYVRFVDDFIVVVRSKAMLRELVGEMHGYLQRELSLTLHRRKHHFQRASHGVLFVGAYLKNGRQYLSNRTAARFAERVHGFNRMFERKSIITLADLQRVEQVTNSYLGFCKGKRTYSLRRRTLLQFGYEFYNHFYIGGHYERIRIKRKAKLINE